MTFQSPALPTLSFVIFSLFSFFPVSAQTPGLIFEPATGSGTSVLDPNGDGYTSSSTGGFTTNDQVQSEIPFIPMVFPATEPNSDLGPGPDCGFTDFVQASAGVEDAGQYYLDASNNWIFRLRLSGASTNSKSYSILIDTDGKFGSSGPNLDPNYVTGNPGFEIELVLATNFGVYVYDVNGTSAPVLKRTYSGHTNYQKSVALSTQCNNADYFYDFYVPFGHLTTDFGITTATALRMVLIDNMAAQSSTIGHLNSASDVGGVDDAATGYNFETLFKNAIDNYPPTCASCSAGLDRSACPVITGPITTGATSVSGTTTHGSGTTVKVYKNSVLIGTVTAGSSGNWTLTGISPALSTGNVIGASATASGKSESIFNCNLVTVTQCSSVPGIISANVSGNTKGLCGNMGAGTPGAGIHVYVNGVLLVPVGGDTATVVSDGSFTWKCNTSNANCSSGAGCLTNNSSVQVIQTVNGCSSDPVCVRIGTGTNATTTAPAITNTPVIINTTTSVAGTSTSGASLFLYANGTQIASGTAVGTAWTLNSLSLSTGQVLTAKAVISGECVSSASTSATVSRESVAPVLAGTYCASTNVSTASGNSIEAAGTAIQVYDNGVAAGTATTVDANGNWAKSGLSIGAGHTITAKATIAGGKQSPASSGITVGTLTTNVVTITNSGLTEGDASVSGTGTNSDVITLYIDGIQIGSTAVVAGGVWTIGSLGAYDLYTNGIVTATATSAGKCESAPSSGLTVQCAAPSGSLAVDPASASVCSGGIIPDIQVSSSQSSVVYQLYNGGSSSGSSRMGTGTDITLASGTLSANTTLSVKAIKISATSCESTLSDNIPVTVYAPDNTWLGDVSSNWFEPFNWCLGGIIPNSSTDITIPAGVPFMPDINASGAACRSITINSGATLTTSGAQNLDVYGNWVNNGSYQANSGTVTFRGTIQQSIGGSVPSNTFANLTINNSGSAGNDIISLLIPATIDGVLTLTDGILNSISGLLSISSTGSAGSGNNSGPSFVSGPMEKTGSSAFVFPLGSGTRWARLGIGAPTATSTFRAQYMGAAYSNTTSMAASPLPALTDVSKIEHWQLDRTGGSGDAQITLYWENAGLSGINDCSDLKIAQFNGTAWENHFDASTTNSSGCPSPTTQSGSIATNADASTFGTLTFGSKSSAFNPLPIKLVSFAAVCQDNQVVLKWNTATEKDNAYFIVECGTSESGLSPITRVNGAKQSSDTLHYEFVDAAATVKLRQTGTLFYRLKQMDFDGGFEYSNLVSISDCGKTQGAVSIEPNPTGGYLHLSSNIEAAMHIEIFNITGQIILQSDFEGPDWEADLQEPAGMYIYVVKDDRQIIESGKIIIR